MRTSIKAGIIGAVAIGAVIVAAAPASAATAPTPDRLGGTLVVASGSAYTPLTGGAIGVGVGTPTSLAAATAAGTHFTIPAVGTTGPVVVAGTSCIVSGPFRVSLDACGVNAAAQSFTTVRNADGSLALRPSGNASTLDITLGVDGRKLVLAPAGSVAQSIVAANLTPSTEQVPGSGGSSAGASLENVFAINTGDGAIIGGKTEGGATVTVSVNGVVVGSQTLSAGQSNIGLVVPVAEGDTSALVSVTTRDGRTASTTVAL
ncbi:hypothetical protein [Curtobacterium sp. Leaf261]|uniref:hypothetical protein n=1 Tax=Curtobacterium sp. Leaf261 TaxID=1736311 RepID=UPI0006F78105|nr:hypothetical protein [Curtobacterium sp. Leaf261]KQO61389.1 hypothetical protein ASF23_13000 [Curtobacterium sp. Leaf261]